MTRVWLVVANAASQPGGVSTHVLSLAKQLDSRGIPSEVVTPRDIARRARGTARGGVVHFHASHPQGLRLLALCLLTLWAGGRRSIITFHHGPAAKKYSNSLVDRLLLRLLLTRVAAVVTLTEEHAAFFSALDPRAIIVRSCSYLGRLSPELATSVPPPSTTTSRRHEIEKPRRWVISSGYESLLYGFHDLVDALVSTDLADIGLRICTYGPEGDPDFVDSLQRHLAAQRLSVDWYRGLSAAEFATLLQDSTVYIRNTTGDSYGLALAESLELGTPAIATNVCRRPEGVMTYVPGDRDGLIGLIHEVLDHEGPRGPSPQLALDGHRSLEALICAYEQVSS